MLCVLCSRTEQEPYICQGTNLKCMFFLSRSTQAQWSCLQHLQRAFLILSSLGHIVFMWFYLFSYGIFPYNPHLRQMYSSKQRSFQACSLDLESVFKSLWSQDLRVRHAPLLALDCCQWLDVAPRRGTQSTSRLMPVCLVLFSKMGFLSPLRTRPLRATVLASPGYSLGSPAMLERTVACHRALGTGLTSTYLQAKQHTGGGCCLF